MQYCESPSPKLSVVLILQPKFYICSERNGMVILWCTIAEMDDALKLISKVHNGMIIVFH